MLTRELVREALLASAIGTEEEVDGYIREFEHLEGDDCWVVFFDTVDEVTNDFQIYIEESE